MTVLSLSTLAAVDSQANNARRRLLMAAAAILSAVLAYLSFPPADIGLLAWVAVVPLLYGLGLARRPGEGFAVGLLYGVAFFALLMHYIATFGVLPLVLLALFQGLFLLYAVVLYFHFLQEFTNEVLELGLQLRFFFQALL